MSRLAEVRHEGDLVAAVTSGRWPAAVDQALREHVASCQVCADVLQGGRSHDRHRAGDAGRHAVAVGLQAAGGARNCARDERPPRSRPTVAQAVGAAAALGLVAARVALAAGTFLSQPLASFDLGLVAWVGVAMGAVLGPLAIYAAVRE